jgi:predicted DNA-binding antitoxin AbrB/MazE fold protein
MNSPFPAIYENGVLKPLQPVDLKEPEVVSPAIVGESSQPASESNEVVRRQRVAWDTMLEETSALPPEGPADEFSNRDHDLVLYGWQK